MTNKLPNLQGLRILVVDDEADNLDLLTFTLETYGAEAIPVASAQQVLDILLQTNPDLLLCDIGMPGMDGYTLIRQVRAMPPEQGGEIPAIALTAYAAKSDCQQALEAGYQKHLAKPIDVNVLATEIANLMGSIFRG